MAAGKGGKN
jgi:hypothetical protein